MLMLHNLLQDIIGNIDEIRTSKTNYRSKAMHVVEYLQLPLIIYAATYKRDFKLMEWTLKYCLSDYSNTMN